MATEDEEVIIEYDGEVISGDYVIASTVMKEDSEEELDIPYIDPEHLISEVQARRVLWDLDNEDCRDKNKRIEAWKEVSAALFGGYEKFSASKKRMIEKAVAARWKNLKDTYRKYVYSERKGLNQIGPRKNRRRYVFASKMKFLDQVILPAEQDAVSTKSKAGPKRQFYTSASPENDVNKPQREDPKRKLTINSSSNEPGFNFLPFQPQFSFHQELDEHQSFFNSLLPIVRSFDDDKLFDFRMGVLNLAQSIKKRSK